MITEPLYHSDITDQLPDGHMAAHTTLYCVRCGEMVHAGNNECMQPWFETLTGAYCDECFRDTYNRLEYTNQGLVETLGGPSRD